MSILKKVIDGVKAAAPTVANYVVPGSGSLVERLMRKVSGDDTSEIEMVAQKIEADPALMVELIREAMDYEAKLADIGLKKEEVEAKKLESVNVTMREESKSEHWPQYSWRPWNGFTWPPTIFAIYFVLPMLNKTVPDVPVWIWMGWLSILGVAVWGRNKEKLAKAGSSSSGIIASTISAIRGGNG